MFPLLLQRVQLRSCDVFHAVRFSLALPPLTQTTLNTFRAYYVSSSRLRYLLEAFMGRVWTAHRRRTLRGEPAAVRLDCCRFLCMHTRFVPLHASVCRRLDCALLRMCVFPFVIRSHWTSVATARRTPPSRLRRWVTSSLRAPQRLKPPLELRLSPLLPMLPQLPSNPAALAHDITPTDLITTPKTNQCDGTDPHNFIVSSA